MHDDDGIGTVGETEGTTAMPQDQPRTYTDSLALLASQGVRYSTVIDIGCAEGYFFVSHYCRGLFPDSVPVMIDANPCYAPVLQEIQDTVGGHYVIAAASDTAGELRFTQGAHPYWSSLRPPSDPYWQRVNNLAQHEETVPAIRLDDLASSLGLKPPYLIKLDVQGAEVQALRGAPTVLAETDVVIVEADIADFRAIDAQLNEAGFDLYDLTTLVWPEGQALGWFYPVYLNRRLNHLREKQFWKDGQNDAMIGMQTDRQQQIRAFYDDVLPKIRAFKKGV